jgi:hypothetical protein
MNKNPFNFPRIQIPNSNCTIWEKKKENPSIEYFCPDPRKEKNQREGEVSAN